MNSSALTCGDAAINMAALRLDEPIVVLTSARSGSTLLRFILDGHPALACPPETSVADLCTRMGVLSMLLEGPPPDDRRALGDGAAESIRSWVTSTFAPYLTRVGKVRWCDKSLGSADSAGRFLSLFPKAKFICLYRHSMDVIDSMIEACPYGLRGYGLDPFVTVHPGNSVAAVADYWVTHTHGIAEFEQRYPESCLRVRYEDLVADPQAQSELIFGFLGEAPVPSITAACFGTARPQFGPGDHKIWDTDQVHADSVGRGARVPAAAIPVTIVALMNSVLDKLGYEPVGEYWNSRPIPVLAGEEDQPAETDPAAVGAVDGAAALDEMEAVLVPHLAARLGKVHEAPDRPGETATSPTITATVPQPAGGVVLARSWRVDLATAIVSRATEDPDVDPDGMWGVIGEAKDWTAVLTGKVGLSAAMRRGCLRMSTPETDRPKQPVPLQYDPYAAVLTWLLTNVGAAPTADSESGLAAEAGRALVPAR